MSDPEDERSSQPGELYATPVSTNEDDVATEAGAVSSQKATSPPISFKPKFNLDEAMPVQLSAKS